MNNKTNDNNGSAMPSDFVKALPFIFANLQYYK